MPIFVPCEHLGFMTPIKVRKRLVGAEEKKSKKMIETGNQHMHYYCLKQVTHPLSWLLMQYCKKVQLPLTCHPLFYFKFRVTNLQGRYKPQYKSSNRLANPASFLIEYVIYSYLICIYRGLEAPVDDTCQTWSYMLPNIYNSIRGR